MNERIKELAEQAGWMMGNEVDGFTTRLEKFAELVIEDSEAHRIVEFIANDYCELSSDKIEWQRNDWRKRCWKYVRGEE